MRTRSYRDLVVWQRAMPLTRESYGLARRMPAAEQFALSSQIRRAAAAIPANIAEGHSSAYVRVFLRHLSIAQGSLTELECHALIALDVGYVAEPALAEVFEECDAVGRMLRRMRAGLLARHASREPRAAPSPVLSIPP
jgi:four helix bundle protein